MRIGLLGPLELDGGAPPRTRRERAVLTALALSRTGYRSTTELIDLVFGAAPPADPLGSLRTNVSRLRRALPDGVLHRMADGYQLRLAAEATDVRRFERGITDAHRLAEAGQWAAAVAAVGGALSEWRGEPLSDLGDGPAADAERRRLVELHLYAEELLAECRLSCEPPSSVVPMLVDAAEREPVREQRWHQLMRALDACGRRTDAMRAYQRARQLLDEMVGLAPGRELQALERDLLADRHQLGAVHASTEPAAPRASDEDRRPRFLAELTRIRAARLSAADLELVDGGALARALGISGARHAAAVLATSGSAPSEIDDPGRLAADAVRAALAMQAERPTRQRVRQLAELAALDADHDRTAARARAREALAHAEDLGDVALVAHVLGTVGSTVGPLQPAGISLAEVVERGGGEADPALTYLAAVARAHDHSHDGADPMRRRLSAMAEASPAAAVLSLWLEASHLLARSELDAAEDVAAELESIRAPGARAAGALCSAAVVFEVRRQQGRLAELAGVYSAWSDSDITDWTTPLPPAMRVFPRAAWLAVLHAAGDRHVADAALAALRPAQRATMPIDELTALVTLFPDAAES